MNRSQRRRQGMTRPIFHADNQDDLRTEWYAKMDNLNVVPPFETLDARRINGLVQAGRAMIDAIITMAPDCEDRNLALQSALTMTGRATTAIKSNPSEED